MKTHILLIDDDINEMKIFVQALRNVTGSFKCTYASNGVHAMKMLLYLRPDVIFTDYKMPAMNGLELAEEIRKVPDLGDIPVFLYSSQFNPAITDAAERIGVTACLQKPSGIEDLSPMLNKVFPLRVLNNLPA